MNTDIIQQLQGLIDQKDALIGDKPPEALTYSYPAFQKTDTRANTEDELNTQQLETVLSLREQSLQLFRQKEYQEAQIKLEMIIKQVPTDIEALFYKGLCLYHTDQLTEALDIMNRLHSIDRNHILSSLPKVYCILLLRGEKYRKAQLVLDDYLNSARYKYDLQLMNMLAYTLERQGRIMQAEKILEDILSFDPTNPNACNSLAYIYYQQDKNIEQAKQLIGQALAKEPNNEAYLDTLVAICKKQNISNIDKKLFSK